MTACDIVSVRSCRLALVAGLLFFSSPYTTIRAGELDVLPPEVEDTAKGMMLRSHLLGLCRDALGWRREAYESLRTAEQIDAYQRRLREFFIREIGAFPERTQLNARVMGVLRKDGYRIEKVIYESRPKHYVTALLFLPNVKPPYPGVLIACGHDREGKAAYQRVAISLALNGIAALAYDPISQGERGQLPFNMGENRGGSSHGHMMAATGSILLGRNTAHFRIWDGIRSIDYLVSRPEIDAERIGCTGNSGGGTLTSYLMALDDRIQVAAPSCYVTSFERLLETIGPQDAEQNIHGQIAFGMDHADYMLMRAPKPTLMCVATRDFFDIGGAWDSFRQAKRIFSRLGFAERVDLVEADEQHGFTPLLRTGAVRWMRRWLLGIDDAVTEPHIEVLPEQQTWCLPDGEVMNLPGARSVYDFNIDLENELAVERRRFWQTTDREEAMREVRRIAGIRPLSELPEAKVQKLGVLPRESYTIEKLLLTPEHGVGLPALMFRPAQPGDDVVLYVHGQGKHVEAGPDGEIVTFVEEGKTVLAVDVLGTGELTPDAVAAAFGKATVSALQAFDDLPGRPPALCKGCPHTDTFKAMLAATRGHPDAILFSDIGCYTLGCLPPFEAVHSCVDMGASISMAHGAAQAGAFPVLCTIGDSTFTHSGMTPLIGAAKADANITVFILDNATVAMTGGQATMAAGDELIDLLRGLGIKEGRLHVIEPLAKHHDQNVELIAREVNHRGLSVIVARRACIQIKKPKKSEGEVKKPAAVGTDGQ